LQADFLIIHLELDLAENCVYNFLILRLMLIISVAQASSLENKKKLNTETQRYGENLESMNDE
jgi:hypothetical protein